MTLNDRKLFMPNVHGYREECKITHILEITYCFNC